MRIVEMHIHSIAIADPPLRSSYGLHTPYALHTVLGLKSDDGIIGIAETYGLGLSMHSNSPSAFRSWPWRTWRRPRLTTGGAAGKMAARVVMY